MDFGTRLRQLREQKEWDRDQLGAKLGMSYSTIAKYETNNRFPDQHTLLKIAETFGVSVDYLIGNSDTKQPQSKPRELPDTVAPYLPEGFEELSPEAKEEVLNFIDYIMVKYGKKEDKGKS